MGGAGVSHLLQFTNGNFVRQILIIGRAKSAGKPKYI